MQQEDNAETASLACALAATARRLITADVTRLTDYRLELTTDDIRKCPAIADALLLPTIHGPSSLRQMIDDPDIDPSVNEDARGSKSKASPTLLSSQSSAANLLKLAEGRAAGC